MTSVVQFLQQCVAIEDSKPRYQACGDGTGGVCDCIGLIIGALRRCGEKWTGIHGSNYAIRNEVHNAQPFDPNMAREGMAVFKYREKGENGWALPDRYSNSPDQRDYYHVGVIMNVKPLSIMHCTTGGGVDGIRRDISVGKWRTMAYINKVDYGGEGFAAQEENMAELQTNAKIYAENGKPVNFRTKPTTEAGAWCAIPVGTKVEKVAVQGSWTQIKYGNRTGYVMSRYLQDLDEDAQPITGSTMTENAVPQFTPNNVQGINMDSVNERLDRIESILMDVTEKISRNHPGEGWG